MGQSRLIILLTISLTGICSEIVPSEKWHDAQLHCRQNQTVLTNALHNASSADGYYWTGYYVRMSQWIKIIGCFRDTNVERTSLLKRTFEMRFPSAGLCQENCLMFNYSVFGVKSTKCVCLQNVPQEEYEGASQCHLLCENKYSNETSIKFSQDCGGEKNYNVFKSDFLKQDSTSTTEMRCLSIQCSEKKFFQKNCNEYLPQVCNKTVLQVNSKMWKDSTKLCKAEKDGYLSGDLPTNDADQACNLINGFASGPSWLGIVKEKYISVYKGQILPLLGTPLTEYLYPKRCLKCNSINCMFADCVDKNNVVCMQMQQTTTSTRHTSSSTTMTINESYTNTGEISSTTGSSKNVFLERTTFSIQSPYRNESLINTKSDSVPIISIALPVTISIAVGSVALILGILWKRRQTEKNAKPKQTQHDTNSPKYSEKNNVDHSLPNNYFVLAKIKSDSSIGSTNSIRDKYSKSPYNESSDGDYDHLGQNFIQKVEEDTYHHAFFSSNEDESDYGVKNINEGILTENPYDHTNTGTYQTTMSDNEYSTISLNRQSGLAIVAVEF